MSECLQYFVSANVANNVDAQTSSWHKLMELERRPLMLTIVVTAALLLIGMLATMLYLLLRPQDTFDNHTGDGDDDRLNIPVESSIGTLSQNFQHTTKNTYEVAPVFRMCWLFEVFRQNELHYYLHLIVIQTFVTGR